MTIQPNGHTASREERNKANLAPFANPAVPGYPTFLTAQPQPVGSLLPAEKFPQNANPPKAFEPITIRGVTFPHRLWVSPMCQYSSDNGHATDHHFVHIGAMVQRGWQGITVEATAYVPEGRITPSDAGIWDDSHIAPLKRQVDFVHAHKGTIGIQLAHAGRKASTLEPWVQVEHEEAGWTGGHVTDDEHGGWWKDVAAASDLSYDNDKYPHPKESSLEYIESLKVAFRAAIERCKKIGFDFIEIHGAHGYYLHNFVDPVSNVRTDQYGGNSENRSRLPLEMAKIARENWDKPSFYRLSASDWLDDVVGPEKGHPGEKEEWSWWGIEQSTILTQKLADIGVDLIDVSSGGNDARQQIKVGPSYQVPFAKHIKEHVKNIIVGAVGIITDPAQANDIIENGEADVVYFARQVLRDIDFPLQAAETSGAAVSPIVQFERAWSRMVVKRDHLKAEAHHEARSEVEGEEGKEGKRQEEKKKN